MSLAWNLLRAEGPAALRDRLLDRLAERRRRRSFRPLAAGEALPRGFPQIDVLCVLPTAPRPDWGGVQTQLRLRLDAQAGQLPWALLYPDDDGSGDGWGSYRLEVRAGDDRIALAMPRQEIGDAIRDATERLGAGVVHVEQSLGLPFGELAALPQHELRLVLSVHDFGLFCRRPHLVERPARRFCHYSRDAERCRNCLARDWQLPEDAQARWRSEAQSLLAAADAVIYPSDFLRRTYAGLFELDADRQHVVAPPAVPRPIKAPPLRNTRLRHLAYVGSVQAHKGAELLLPLIERLRAAGHDLRWSVYGGGDAQILRRLRRLPGVRVRGYYRAGSLPRRLRRDGVDLALLLSIWPETYALTLDECRLAGVPVVAFDHGAPAERISLWGAGWTVDPAADPETATATLADAVSARIRGDLKLPEQNPANPADARSAAEQMLKIYQSLPRSSSQQGSRAGSSTAETV